MFAEETTHTPQGDGNALTALSLHGTIWKQPTPRKGTETAPSLAKTPRDRKQPTPRKGTETPDLLPVAHLHVETTHTPQGDGNLHPAGKPINHSKQPTPRKGTETPRRYGTGCKSARKQPTPRKGTETGVSASTDGILRNNPHPARGRKPLFRGL